MADVNFKETQKEFKESFKIKSFWVGVALYFLLILIMNFTNYLPSIVSTIVNFLPSLALAKSDAINGALVKYIMQPIIFGFLIRIIVEKIKAMLLWFIIILLLVITLGIVYSKDIISYLGGTI